MSDVTTKPATLAREFYRPLAEAETRRAVARYVDAKRRRFKAAEAADETLDALGDTGKPFDRLSAFTEALRNEYRDAERALVKIVAAWDEAALDHDVQKLPGVFWPPRGVIVDEVLYLVTPVDPDECEGTKPGERPKYVEESQKWIVQIQVTPLASVVNLDSPAASVGANGASSPPERSAATGATVDPAEADDAPKATQYRHPRHAPPMLRFTMTLAPPWDPYFPTTLECIALPGGSGSQCEDEGAETEGAPINRSDLPELHEAGWQEHQGVGATFFLRSID